MKRIYAIVTMLAVLASCGTNADRSGQAEVSSEYERTEVSSDSLECVEGKVRNGQFFSTLMMHLGMTAQQAYDLTQACSGVFDVKALRVGNTYKAYYSAGPQGSGASQDDKVLQSVVYDRDRTSQVIFSCQPPYEVRVHQKPVTVKERYADVTISTSLWVDMIDAGVCPELIISLSDIYAWTVDFFGLQKGDRFRVLYEEKICGRISKEPSGTPCACSPLFHSSICCLHLSD